MATIETALSIRSIDGNKVPVSVDFNLATTSGLFADISAYETAFVPLYDAVIQGQIVDITLRQRLAIPGGLKVAPVPGSNNTIGALLNYASASPLEKASLWIPSWIPAGFNTPTHENQVLTTQAAVAAFLAALLATANTTTVTDEDGNNLTTLLKAVKSDRKQRRALSRSR
jgi:hypothetical protein